MNRHVAKVCRSELNSDSLKQAINIHVRLTVVLKIKRVPHSNRIQFFLVNTRYKKN